MRALDLYCGAGGASRGLQQAGFHVTGVDLYPQPNYCGDVFVQADALRYLKTADLSRFDYIHTSPPCPRFTALKTGPNAKGDAHPDLIKPTRELLKVTGLPYVIENVEGAKKHLIDPVMLCGRHSGLRRRRTTPHPTASNYNGTDCLKSPASRFPRRHAGIAADRSSAFMVATSATGADHPERIIAAVPTCHWSSPLPPWASRSDR